MKFVFEATIGEFNEAAEYGILLRKASRQKRANIIGLSICVLALIIVQALTAQYDLDKVTITEIYLLAAMTAVLVMDRGGSLTRKALRMFSAGSWVKPLQNAPVWCRSFSSRIISSIHTATGRRKAYGTADI